VHGIQIQIEIEIGTEIGIGTEPFASFTIL